MADGPADTDNEGGRPEDGPILSPDELDISESEHVTEIDEGRFVVSADAKPERGAPSGESSSDSGGNSNSMAGSGAGNEPRGEQTTQGRERGPDAHSEQTLDDRTVHRWLEQSFTDSNSRYGFDVTASFDGSVSQRRMASNDLVTIFESLVLWYAQQVDNDRPVEEILGLLLMKSNVPVRYPPSSLKSVVQSAGLGPDDTVAELLAAVNEDDGLKL
jgi:hypothetical protein